MSPRRFTGWEPRRFTEFHYEGNRLVGAVEYSEPEWCEADRLAVLGELERRRLQGAHGQPLDEATDPRANPSSRDAEWSYVAEPFIDFAQQALDKAADAYQKRYGDDVPAGLKWSVRKVPR